MSTEITALRQTLVRQLKTGPNAAVAPTPGWQWEDAVWCLAMIGWFGTTGRVSDVAVAVSLVVYWIFGPAIGVFVGGNLLILALGILPISLVPLLVTELLLFAPVILEAHAATTDRSVAVVHSAAGLLVIIAAVVGSIREWALLYLAASLVGGYALSVVGMQVTSGLYTRREEEQINDPSGDNSA